MSQAIVTEHIKTRSYLTYLNLGALIVGSAVVYRLWRNGTLSTLTTAQESTVQKPHLRAVALQERPADSPIVMDVSDFDPDPLPFYGPTTGHHHH